MSMVGFLHTAEVHVGTFDSLVGDAAETVHAVEPGLLEQARADGLTPVVEAGVRSALDALAARGARVVVCTCSTLGPVAESVASPVPVLRVDRPMARVAVASGSRIGVVAAVESTLEPTRSLLEDEARRAGADPAVTDVLVPGAWASFEAGDTPAYLSAIADAARALAGDVDVVVLAQASMAGAVGLVADLDVPVLASPRLAVESALSLP
ncbi:MULTISPECIES: aspartate/glutamate racemase family protein [unclassified Nocardioides]|uniref:aspartate/glutamate racemase family protein n=1 Tax=unclassified Nocardioides TaxID=2615069 RepID=UPI00362240CD